MLCDKCNKRGEAVVGHRFLRLPRVLVLQLKRFKPISTDAGFKINKMRDPVIVDKSLDICTHIAFQLFVSHAPHLPVWSLLMFYSLFSAFACDRRTHNPIKFGGLPKLPIYPSISDTANAPESTALSRNASSFGRSSPSMELASIFGATSVAKSSTVNSHMEELSEEELLQRALEESTKTYENELRSSSAQIQQRYITFVLEL